MTSASSAAAGATSDAWPRAAGRKTLLAGADVTFIRVWAAWCEPCREFAPVFEAASAQYPEITFGKVDTEAERELAAAARITSIPTLMAFKGSHLVFSQLEALPAPALEQLIQAVVAQDVETAVAEATSGPSTPWESR
jgi:thioredoxin 1